MVNLKVDIPEGFLDEEVRCGYTISSKMKEVWAVQLDLFAEFDRVCRKYDIKYVASGGTLLGAVRHHGYIPWDDDMDLMMMRDQYEKLCEVAPSEFRHPYFFQTEYTDPGMHRWFARLRNSETTALQRHELPYHLKYNQGIFIDIFPMDHVVDDKRKFRTQYNIHQRYFKWYCWLNSTGNSFRSENDPTYKKIGKKILNTLFGEAVRRMSLTQIVYKKTEEVCCMYNHMDTIQVSLLSFQFNDLRHAVKRLDMNDIIEIPFEFLMIPVIANYDEHLRRKYGDYLTLVKSHGYHGELFFDTNVNYNEYYRLHPEMLK